MICPCRSCKSASRRCASGADIFDETLITGDAFKEVGLYREVIERRSAAQDYLGMLQRLQREAAIKRQLFGTADAFTAEVLLKTEEIYHDLEQVTPDSSFSGATEVLSNWHGSDLLVLLFGLLAGLLLLTQERSAGLLCLLRPTKHGHARLYSRKLGAMGALLLLGFAVIYGTNLAIAGTMFGFGDPSRALQSVYGLAECPFALSVGQYLAVFLAARLLWCWAVCALFFLLCSSTGKVMWVLLGSALVLGLALMFERSDSLWLRALSLSAGMQTARLITRCIFLNFAGRAVPMVYVVFGFTALLALLSPLLGCVVFCKQPAVGGGGKLHFRLPRLRSVSHFAHEGWKLLFAQGGLVILLLLAGVQYAGYQEFFINRSLNEQAYRNYSQQLSGAPSASKQLYLQQEQSRYEALQALCDAQPDGRRKDELRRELQPMDGFYMALAQYQSLGAGQSYVYSSGYERLYSGQGVGDDLRNTMLLVFALIVSFSGCFAVEAESGVCVLQSTAGKERKIARYKRIHCGVFLLLAMLIVYLPQYLCVLEGYGLPQLSAQANSLGMFSLLPSAISLRGLLILTALARLALAWLAAALILRFSRKTGNTIVTVLLSVGLLIVPLAIALLLL